MSLLLVDKEIIKLSVNIDHIAILWNVRNADYPNLIKTADAENEGADFITLYLREDRRHIIDNKMYSIASTSKDTDES